VKGALNVPVVTIRQTPNIEGVGPVVLVLDITEELEKRAQSTQEPVWKFK
jgi:hypothetical protein